MKLSNRFRNIYNLAFGLLLLAAGYVMIIIFGNWKIALGLFLAFWGESIMDQIQDYYDRG